MAKNELPESKYYISYDLIFLIVFRVRKKRNLPFCIQILPGQVYILRFMYVYTDYWVCVTKTNEHVVIDTFFILYNKCIMIYKKIEFNFFLE